MNRLVKIVVGSMCCLAWAGTALAQAPRPSAGEIARIEARIQDWAKQQGYTTVRDDQGRLVARDKNGKVVRPPSQVVGQHAPQPTDVAKAEARIKAWAAKNGYSTVRDKDGRLVGKDAQGNLIRPPLQ